MCSDNSHRFYAHSTSNPDKTDWQLLKDHLQNTALMAKKFADSFGAGQLGEIAGLLHDIGKYSGEFQKRLEGSKIRVDHSTAGAQEAEKHFYGKIGRVLAYVIAGHHGGIPNGNNGANSNLFSRLKSEIPDYSAFEREFRIPELKKEELLKIPTPKSFETREFSISFFIRILYSCLVDSDYLDTEKFMNPMKSGIRVEPVEVEKLNQRFCNVIYNLNKKAVENPTVINKARNAILARCLEAASGKPGFYTLTVPTGGGKTYSSLAFALKHASLYGKKRIIYVISYTSIIEQNADVFRNALGEGVVLEHHSNYEYPESTFDDWNEVEQRHRLATENWDSALITTTSVQFFESLFSNKSSRCRKLHSIVNSVIILDEAQMMPLDFLRPCLWALSELVQNYGSTVVMCTATQPAIGDMLPSGLKSVEIMENPENLQDIFKRVNVEYVGQKNDDEIVDIIADTPQCLCIVNTRKHSMLLYQRLYQKLNEGVYHLSARMCPAHRKEKLKIVRNSLSSGALCRVISTQLIEAGVDVDFPMVFRSSAGLDSIAQAAGRCNREGKLKDGQVFVFEPETHGMPKKGRFEETAGLMRSTLRRFPGNLLTIEAIKDYFSQLYDFEKNNLDKNDILKIINEGRFDMAFPFSEVSDTFSLIDQVMVSIVIPFNENARSIINKLRYNSYPGSFARSLQPYTIQVYPFELFALQKAGAIGQEKTGELYWILEDMSFYDDEVGLKDPKEVTAPNEVLIF